MRLLEVDGALRTNKMQINSFQFEPVSNENKAYKKRKAGCGRQRAIYLRIAVKYALHLDKTLNDIKESHASTSLLPNIFFSIPL